MVEFLYALGTVLSAIAVILVAWDIKLTVERWKQEDLCRVELLFCGKGAKRYLAAFNVGKKCLVAASFGARMPDGSDVAHVFDHPIIVKPMESFNFYFDPPGFSQCEPDFAWVGSIDANQPAPSVYGEDGFVFSKHTRREAAAPCQ